MSKNKCQSATDLLLRPFCAKSSLIGYTIPTGLSRSSVICSTYAPTFQTTHRIVTTPSFVHQNANRSTERLLISYSSTYCFNALEREYHDTRTISPWILSSPHRAPDYPAQLPTRIRICGSGTPSFCQRLGASSSFH